LTTPLECPVCHDIFYGSRGLNSHLAWTHPEQPKHCYKCGIELTEENAHYNGRKKRNLCKECHNKMGRKYYHYSPEISREYHRKQHSEITAKIFSFLGNKCVHCGIDDKRVLQIDHVNNNGADDKRRFGSFSTNYRRHVLDRLLNGSKEYQLLCANCNIIKVYANAEINHGKV